jgi:hypothetical protein
MRILLSIEHEQFANLLMIPCQFDKKHNVDQVLVFVG